jgi:hypothetical protein
MLGYFFVRPVSNSGYDRFRFVAERRDEPTISHEELIAELQRDGLV